MNPDPSLFYAKTRSHRKTKDRDTARETGGSSTAVPRRARSQFPRKKVGEDKVRDREGRGAGREG